MTEGHLADNILYFARALRAAGMPVGPGSVLDALEGNTKVISEFSTVQSEILRTLQAKTPA